MLEKILFLLALPTIIFIAVLVFIICYSIFRELKNWWLVERKIHSKSLAQLPSNVKSFEQFKRKRSAKK